MKFKISIFFVLAVIFLTVIFLSLKQEGVMILEYHQITNSPPEPLLDAYSVPPKDFSDQLDYLTEEGFTTITLQDFMLAVYNKKKLPQKPIILTFDDGYKDNYENALPILKAHNMTAVFYVVTNLIGNEGYLSLDNLKEMQRQGFEIGSHTSDHLQLTTLDASNQRRQIQESKKILEYNGIKNIYSFSYPNGEFNSDSLRILREEKYSNAVTGKTGLNTVDTDPYQLCRIHIRKPHFGLLEFKLRLFKAKIFALLKKYIRRV